MNEWVFGVTYCLLRGQWPLGFTGAATNAVAPDRGYTCASNRMPFLTNVGSSCVRKAFGDFLSQKRASDARIGD